MQDLFYPILGYLMGSILFARVSSQLLGRRDITENTCDENPGATNAFKNGGFWCGFLTLLGDLLKGALPVFLCLRSGRTTVLAMTIAAPVLGHIYPVFYGFRGGKGIATTFGVLLGLLPRYAPVLTLALYFIFFSLVVVISPHYYRTLAAYLCTLVTFLLTGKSSPIVVGFALVFLAVAIRLMTSQEEKQPCKVGLIWKR